MSTNNLRWTSIYLPSKGLLYEGKIPDGKVEIRKLLVGEEVIIQSSSSGVDMISRLISACVRLPGGFPHANLLATDRLALLLALRVYTFGPKYSFSYKCQNCGATNRFDVDLTTDIKPREITELSEPVRVQLPDCEKTVGLRFIRGVDEAEIQRTAQRVNLQSNDAADSSNITRLLLQLVEVDGNNVDSAAKDEFVRGLTMNDVCVWRDALDDKESGLDLTFHTECKRAACASPNQVVLPFSADFFRPTRVRA